MPEFINQNRFVATNIANDVLDFKIKSGSGGNALYRSSDGDLYFLKGDRKIRVNYSYSNSVLNRSDISSRYDCSNLESIDHVISLGLNPYVFFDSKFNCPYYSKFDGTIWSTIGNESRRRENFAEYCELISVESGRTFVFFQDFKNVDIYEIKENSIDFVSTMSGFYLIGVRSSANDLIICASKFDTSYPSQSSLDPLFDIFVTYYPNSPIVISCSEASNYGDFSPFVQNRSCFPVSCQLDRRTVSFEVVNNKVFLIANIFDFASSSYVSCCGIGIVGDSWRFLKNVYPFPGVYNSGRLCLLIDKNLDLYASCKKENSIYLSYFSKTDNLWKNYDKTLELSFSNVALSSSSSSSSSTSFSSSSSSCSSSSSSSSYSFSSSSSSCSSSSSSSSSLSCSSSSSSSSSLSCSSSSSSSSSCSCSSSSYSANGGNFIYLENFNYLMTESGNNLILERGIEPTFDLLVVAGGGSGGTRYGGGGGGGGVISLTSQTLSLGSHSVVVGSGAASQTANQMVGLSGQNSSFDALVAFGGGGGGTYGYSGLSGGCGGGGAYSPSYLGGTGAQGGDGGSYVSGAFFSGCGGGGAGGSGGVGAAGSGGVGFHSSITGVDVGYSGGGGGSSYPTYGTAGSAVDGGGAGSNTDVGTPGTNGLGGGGGAASGDSAASGAGGSGVVIVRYLTGSVSATGGVVSSSGSYTTHTFLSDGTFSISGV